MTKLSFSMRPLATLAVLCASTMTAQACSCMEMPTIESSFENDWTTGVVEVEVGNEIPPEDPNEPYYTKRYTATIRNAFKADRCGRLQELNWRQIEVQTANNDAMCGVHIEEHTTYLMAGNLDIPEDFPQNPDSIPILSTGSCDLQTKWEDLAGQDVMQLYWSRYCRCHRTACAHEANSAEENYLCPDEETLAGPGGSCRFDPAARQCSSIVQCPKCEEDWDCRYDQYCSRDGRCTKQLDF